MKTKPVPKESWPDHFTNPANIVGTYDPEKNVTCVRVHVQTYVFEASFEGEKTPDEIVFAWYYWGGHQRNGVQPFKRID